MVEALFNFTSIHHLFDGEVNINSESNSYELPHKIFLCLAFSTNVKPDKLCLKIYIFYASVMCELIWLEAISLADLSETSKHVWHFTFSQKVVKLITFRHRTFKYESNDK